MADDSDQNQDDGRGHERPEREEEAPANNVGLIPLGNQGTLADPALTDPSMDGAQPGAPPAYPDSLLGNPHLSGRGNSPVREAIVQRWQQTYGNRATQRMLQRFKEGTGPSESDDLAERIQSKSGSGTGLDPGVRVQLERTVGADMSNVQVHTDSEAHRLAQSVDAIAFTTGSDIFFREGAYNPASADGLKLLAHEATHTVQQSQGPVSGTPTAGGVSVSDPSDAFEQEAARVAESVAAAPPQSQQAAAPASSNAVHAQRTHAHREDEEQDSPLPMQAYRPSQPAVQREAAPSDERDEEQHIPESDQALQRLAASSASPLPVQRDGAAAPAKKAKGTTTINPVVPKTYKVTGKTLQDAVDDIGQRDEAGETTWEPKLKYDLDDNGNVKSATITVTVTVTMPNWPDAAKLNKAAKAEWDRFMKALQKHEDGHVKIAKDKFKDSADRLIGKSESDAQAEFEKIKQEVQDASDEYDTANDHGQKEGTIVDVDAGAPKTPAPPPKSSSSPGAQSDASDVLQPDDENTTSVQTYVQRQPAVGRGAAWSDADTGTYTHPVTPDNPATPAGGWNAGNQMVGKVERIPIDGLTTVGNQDAAMGTKADPAPTAEGAAGKAIVCVPDTVGTTKSPEVLLHLHGFNVGYRERDTAKPGVAGMEAGTVRDVSVDRIEAQLQASGRPMVAILPQGTMTSGFGDLAKNSSAYISEVFSRLIAMQKLPAGATPGRVVVSGHSGAGAPISQMLAAGTLPANTGELALFDAINGTGQLAIVQNWLLNGKTGQMPQDLAALKKIAADGQAAGGSADDIKQAQLTYLSTSMRFIAFYSPKYPDLDPVTKQPKTDAQGHVIMKGYGVVHEALNAAMEAWKNANLKGLAPEVVKAFRDNYQVLPAGHGDHEKMVGNKDALLKALSVLPPAPPAPAAPPSSSSTGTPGGSPGGQGQPQKTNSGVTPSTGDGPSDAGAGDAGKDTGDLGGTSLPGGVSDASGSKDDELAPVQAMRASTYSALSPLAVQRQSVPSDAGAGPIAGVTGDAGVQQGTATGPTPSTTPAPPTAAPPHQETPAERDQLVTSQIEQFLDSFSNITVTVSWQENGQAQNEQVAVHPPYFINTEGDRRAAALRHRSEARGAMANLLHDIQGPAPEVPQPAGQEGADAADQPQGHGHGHGHTPPPQRAIQEGDVHGRSRTLVGKSTPEDIRTIVQDALGRGVIQAGQGRTHPNSDDIHAWLVTYGIGIDCSGFVSQALNQVMSAVPGGAGAAQLDIANTGSGSLQGQAGRGALFTRVTSPADLHPGDTMHKPGHIRIVLAVEITSEGVQITTAESSSRSDIGPTRNIWLYPHADRFDGLRVRRDGPPPQPRHGHQSADQPQPAGGQQDAQQPQFHWEASDEQITWGRYSRLQGTRPAQPSAQPAAQQAAQPVQPTLQRLSLQRAASVGWSGVHSGPNAQETPQASAAARDFGQIRRIPLRGFGSGRGAANREAIVLIPSSVATPAQAPSGQQGGAQQGESPQPSGGADTSATSQLPAVEVLLHLHGHNVGYQGTSLGNVRDVQKDQIEQQLQASNRRMIAILPQGTHSSEFGISDPNQYIRDVMQGLTDVGAWGTHAAPSVSSVILSGHSGAGFPISQMLGATGSRAIANMGGLFLFDAINGPNEQRAVMDWLEAQLRHDLGELTNSTRNGNTREQQNYLATSPRFRGFYTPGHYAGLYQPVINLIKGWFTTKLPAELAAAGATLDQAIITQWSANYQASPAGHSSHDYIVGTGQPAAPGQGGSGALFNALSSLPPGSTGGSGGGSAPASQQPQGGSGSSSSSGTSGGGGSTPSQGSTQPSGGGSSGSSMDAGTPSGSGPSDAGLPGGVGPSSQAEQNEEPATVQTMRASSVPQAAVQRHVWPVFARPTIQRVSIPQAPVPVQRDFKKQTYKLSSTKIAVVKGDAKKKMAEIDESPADYSAAILKKAGLKPEDWFKSFTTTTFLGRSIGEPIHTDLATHLKDVEKKFTDKYGGDEKSPAKAGDALGLSHESIAGGREAPTSAVFSMHLFGLAVDLNYTANPFISASANPVFNRAGLLVDGTAAAWKPNMSYDDLSALDKKLETYFSYLDKPDDLKARLDASTAAPWKGMAPEKAKKQIQADLDLVAQKWERSDPSKKATIKAGGFMDLKKELVEGIGLNWGASYGDMMHFDMRNKGNGAKIEAAIGQYKAEKEKESKEQYQKEHGKEAMAEEGDSDTAVALNEEGNEAEDAAPAETGAGSAAGESQPVQAMRARSSLLLAGRRDGPVLARPSVQRVSVSRAGPSVQRDTPDAGSSVAAPPPAKQTIATIEQFIKFVETVESTYPTADPKEVASEIRQIWFSDPNWEVLLGSQGISSTDASGKKTYTDIETEAPIATAYDMKDLDPRGTEKKIRTPLGEVAISHVIAGIDAALSGAPSSYPQNFLKDRGHDSDDTRLKYDTLKAADAGDPRDFTTWSGDLGQAYAEYLVERWVKASTGASLASFVSDKASDDQLLGDIHGYIAKQVATEVPPSKGAAAKVGKVSDILRSLYMAGKKDAGADQSYMHYFEQAAGKKAADLRPFILERTLAFARPWYANKAFAASGSSDVGRWWSSKGFKAKTILENHMKDFDKWHAENESKATAPNKIGEYIDKFLKMLGQKMP